MISNYEQQNESKITKLQEQLSNKFEEIREQFNHYGNKGTNGEYIVRDFLRDYFPPQYRFGNGEVIDSKGRQSGQVDIIITNKYHPFLNDYSKPSIFLLREFLVVEKLNLFLHLKNYLRR